MSRVRGPWLTVQLKVWLRLCIKLWGTWRPPRFILPGVARLAVQLAHRLQRPKPGPKLGGPKLRGPKLPVRSRPVVAMLWRTF